MTGFRTTWVLSKGALTGVISLKKTSFAHRAGLWLLALMSLSACWRSPYPPPVPVGNDTSIRFPDFSAQEATVVGETHAAYQLDGVTLRAIMIAANDYIPPGTRAPEDDCLFRQDTQFYRVIRQGDIIFVDVSWNSSACVPRAYPLDGGARYAISTDGRILRRLVGIEPDGFPREEPPRVSIPVPNHLVGHPFEEIRAYYRDAGIPFPGDPPARAYPLDGGARYAISTDGRILRRLVGIEPDGFPREEPPRVSIPVPNHLVGHPFEEIRAYYRDAGIPFPGDPPADGGVPAPPDGGLAGDSRDGGT